jgi:hypothetical protein
MVRTFAAGMAVFVLTAGAPEGMAQGKGKGRADQGKSNTTAAPAVTVKTSNNAFGTDEARIIREWFSNSANLKGLPPGLAKKEQLPPGLQKQLARNGKLPPGLEKKIQPLPRDLELRLPGLPDGRRRIVIAGNIILLDERTSMIVDILQNIF